MRIWQSVGSSLINWLAVNAKKAKAAATIARIKAEIESCKIVPTSLKAILGLTQLLII